LSPKNTSPFQRVPVIARARNLDESAALVRAGAARPGSASTSP